MGLTSKVSVLALVLWLVYEARRLHQEFKQCEADYADNLVYLAQPMCTDTTYRALWEGKRVHCGEAERHNQEHRLACAYRKWWDTSDWRTFWLQVTGNHWLLTASICTSILGTLWLISTVLAGRREDARAKKLLDMQAQFMQTLAPPRPLGAGREHGVSLGEPAVKQLEFSLPVLPGPREAGYPAPEGRGHVGRGEEDKSVIYLRARPAAAPQGRRLVGKRARLDVSPTQWASEESDDSE